MTDYTKPYEQYIIWLPGHIEPGVLYNICMNIHMNIKLIKIKYLINMNIQDVCILHDFSKLANRYDFTKKSWGVINNGTYIHK